ncbi:MAG: hypothetical protein DWQ35_18890 [Planctomycetota bacterium]|nr:MAG: hypothetical protein DWQ35_18890 [Planctomycetota bacterium]
MSIRELMLGGIRPMRLFCTLTFTIVCLTTSVASAKHPVAGWFHHFDSHYARNKAWPEPYVYQDRAAAVAPLGVMVNNGWRHQNLIGPHNFKPDTTELNESGLLKVRWIVTQAPVQRRTVFVERGMTHDETAARMRDVQTAADRFLVGPEVADVRETHITEYGWSGDYADLISTKFRASTGDPRLPAESGSFDVD